MNITRDLLAVVAAFVVLTALYAVLIFMPHTTTRTVNCSVAEISPDITPKEREACRLLRATKL